VIFVFGLSLQTIGSEGPTRFAGAGAYLALALRGRRGDFTIAAREPEWFPLPLPFNR
jgi:hypothetical protein